MKLTPKHLFLTVTIVTFFSLVVTVHAETDKLSRRISLAISGGASKGAYEAGLNWAALKIMLEFSGEKGPILGGEYRPFEAVSFAGASAGGINSLLSGLTWCLLPESEGGLPNSVDDNMFRNVWLAPDVNRLLPSTANSPYYLPDDALLSRKNLLDAASYLRDKWNTPSFRNGCRVPLGVTVTRVEPEVHHVGDIEVQNQRFNIPFELRVRPDNTVVFAFDPADYPGVRDPAWILLPRRDGTPPFSISDQQIVDSVLTSSAFPVAFSRKRLQYCRSSIGSSPSNENKETENAIQSDKSDLLCPQGYELAEAEFADGGLFDNLPIGLARKLAESNRRAKLNPLPITYLYLDPDRTRYETPGKQDSACEGPNPPEACHKMEYSLFSESRLLLGAMGTARKYELYRELTSDHWTHNLTSVSYELAHELEEIDKTANCDKHLPFFERPLDCGEALRRAGRLLELAYNRVEAPITPPYSIESMRKAGIIKDCSKPDADRGLQVIATCSIDFAKYRPLLGDAMINIIDEVKLSDKNIKRRIRRSLLTQHSDRTIVVTSLGTPITGTLMGSFGAFLEYKFREYDYYVGIYDVIIMISDKICRNHYSPEDQGRAFNQCRDNIGELFYNILGLQHDAKGKYVFSLLARNEYEDAGVFRFGYEPMPAKDNDMHIINEALAETLKAGYLHYRTKRSGYSVEKTFFELLREKGFEPTPTGQKARPLIAQIMDDPDLWSNEMVKRVTGRLVHLEKEAERVYAEREPDPEKREESNIGLMGVGSYALRSTTYKHPGFTFAPSTASEKWFWRNIIPYEIGFDLADSDLLLTWQPTWSLSPQTKLGVRGSIGFAEGILQSRSEDVREDYLAIGLDLSRIARSFIYSSWGIGSTYYHTFKQPELDKQDTLGFDVHIGIIKDRLRLSIGTRDINDITENWFLLLGITDLPGMTYWLTR